ncbi:hypothetical protein G7Y89_g219 [Cudoniella acicularis]|uniref:NACHT domain-containing protein n=1 Tax=Cudoniella acicularis TaxID=354080 RepID=A0A8H4W930_9HELO|nr:hypothetical protein G7Y89_g219 [Cudoniella acicularis]
MQLIDFLIQVYLEDLRKHPDYEKRTNCHKLFRTSNYKSHKERNPSPVEGTYVSAYPGCGKSVLSRFLADKVLPVTKSRTTCYFFFRDDNEDQKTVTNAPCAILHQLFSQKHKLLEYAVKCPDRNGDDFAGNIDLLWNLLVTVSADPQAGEIVCILDALDKCKQLELETLLGKLCSFYNQDSRSSSGRCLEFLATSSPLQDIEDAFNNLSQKIPSIHLASEERTDQIRDEIDLVIEYELGKIQQKRHLNLDTISILRGELTRVEHRTYLWLKFIIDLIYSHPMSVTKRGRKEIFGTIPTTVNDAYTAILNKSENKDLAMKLLQIVCAATRPLSVIEMGFAMSIEPDDRAYKDLEICPPTWFTNLNIASHLGLTGVVYQLLKSPGIDVNAAGKDAQMPLI